MSLTRASLVAAACLATTALAADIEVGPLVHEYRLTLSPGEAVQAVGPLFSHESRDGVEESAFHPFISYFRDYGTDVEELDLLYPFLTYDRYGTEYRLQLFQLISWAGGDRQDGERARRFTLFPFYFQQRSSDPAQNYLAIGPFYGRLHNRLFRDEVRYVMFPLYSQSKKKDFVTDNYLYPFFHRRHGENLSGWQFWPLVGHEQKEPALRTNALDEVEIWGGHRKFFALWPLYLHQNLGIGTTNPQSHRVLLPFYSLQRSPNRDASTYLWPFVNFVDDRANSYREWGTPWPMVVFGRGTNRTVNRAWPLFGQTLRPDSERLTFAWPLIMYTRAHPLPLDRSRLRVLFFLYSDVVERNRTTETHLRRTAMWPLFIAQREHNGDKRLQLLALLEPVLPVNHSIERNYSPLWSLWRSESSARTGASSQSLLWNLYRRDATPEARKCSLLFGLFQYHSTSEGKRLRLFFIPFGQSKQRPPARPD